MLTGGWALRVLAALAREHPRLGDSVSCHLGLKTGANAIFLDPPGVIEPDLVRPAIRGRDIRPFRAPAGARNESSPRSRASIPVWVTASHVTSDSRPAPTLSS